MLPTPTLEEDYFGHFTVLQVLGRGSFAEAVKVSDDQDRVFAIKRTIMPFSGYKDRFVVAVQNFYFLLPINNFHFMLICCNPIDFWYLLF